jgi:hypothetical protein
VKNSNNFESFLSMMIPSYMSPIKSRIMKIHVLIAFSYSCRWVGESKVVRLERGKYVWHVQTYIKKICVHGETTYISFLHL